MSKDLACYAEFDRTGPWEIRTILNYVVISRKKTMCKNVRNDVTRLLHRTCMGCSGGGCQNPFQNRSQEQKERTQEW